MYTQLCNPFATQAENILHFTYYITDTLTACVVYALLGCLLLTSCQRSYGIFYVCHKVKCAPQRWSLMTTCRRHPRLPRLGVRESYACAHWNAPPSSHNSILRSAGKSLRNFFIFDLLRRQEEFFIFFFNNLRQMISGWNWEIVSGSKEWH